VAVALALAKQAAEVARRLLGLGRIALEVEARAVAVVAEVARERVSPLRLIRVDVDAGVALLVRPAAGELLATDAVALGGLAARLALGHVRVAAGAGARHEETLVLARARHAELHLAALRPLVRLLVDRIADNAGVGIGLSLGLGLEAHRHLLRRLGRDLGAVVGLGDVAPGHTGVLLGAEGNGRLVQQRVRRAVAAAVLVRVALGLRDQALARHDPVAVAAVPHGEAIALVQGEVRVAHAPAGAGLEVLVGLGVPRAVEDVVEGHLERLSWEWRSEGACLGLLVLGGTYQTGPVWIQFFPEIESSWGALGKIFFTELL
jgi:hypothetical protein